LIIERRPHRAHRAAPEKWDQVRFLSSASRGSDAKALNAASFAVFNT
jgi:hypothetical protein